MSEEMFIGDYAPKQIWIDEHSEWWPTHSRSDTTPYIRADIFNDLVKAFGEVLRISDRDHEAWNKAQAALKKLEEE